MDCHCKTFWMIFNCIFIEKLKRCTFWEMYCSYLEVAATLKHKVGRIFTPLHNFYIGDNGDVIQWLENSLED